MLGVDAPGRSSAISPGTPPGAPRSSDSGDADSSARDAAGASVVTAGGAGGAASVPAVMVAAPMATAAGDEEPQLYLLRLSAPTPSDPYAGGGPRPPPLVARFQEVNVEEDPTHFTVREGRNVQKEIPMILPTVTGEPNVVWENISISHDMSSSPKTVKKIDALVEKVVEKLKPNIEVAEVSEADTLPQLLNTFKEKARETAFYVVNLSTLVAKYKQWELALPRVKPFYAIKCNGMEGIVRTLQFCGTGFDCASLKEMERVLSLGTSPDDIIFANPCKVQEHLKYAAEHGVTMMTFDNAEELKKVHALCPGARMVLRILPPDAASAACAFGSKFGANKISALKLLKLAKDLDIAVVGISFHVGSGCFSVQAYVLALKLAKEIWDKATEMGHQMSLLDIGGGFPGFEEPNTLKFTDITDTIRTILDETFPPPIRIIAEPGRYFAAECVTLAVNIIAKRDFDESEDSDSGREDEGKKAAESSHAESFEHPPEKEGHLAVPPVTPPGHGGTGRDHATEVVAPANPPQNETLYYMADGVYGSFNCTFFDHTHPQPKVLYPTQTAENEITGAKSPTHRSTLFGPTCDSIDMICRSVDLPDLEVGDWLYFINMGAYTVSAATNFNGFTPPPCRYVITYGYETQPNAADPAPVAPASPSPPQL